MVHEIIDGTYRQTNLPNESPEYLAKREELRLAEIELRQQRERVAELRRALPQGATITDYEFLEGPTSLADGDEPVRKTRLSELFTAPDLLGSEDRQGQQDSTISVFTRESDGTLRHFYSVHPRLAEDIDERVIDEYTPIWNILDLTPQGRGTFYASLDYGTKVQAARR